MEHSSFQPVKSLLTARSAQGQLALVVLDDGRYGITREGELLPEHFWPASELNDCIDVFLKLSRDGRAA